MDQSHPKVIKLHSYFRSSASWRVRIVLNLKNVHFEYIPVHLLKDGGQQRTPEYEKINPMKHVPALEVDGEIIVESMAICEYLEETFTTPSLLPKDPFKKAQVRACCEMVNSGMQPLINLKILQYLESKNVEKNEWIETWVTKGLDALNKYLEGKAGKYSFGDELTLADAFLAPMVEGAVSRFNTDISKFENLKRVIENLREIPAFQKALPKNQPDAE